MLIPRVVVALMVGARAKNEIKVASTTPNS